MSLGDILGPEFDAAPALLFGPDRFHPSADGYRALADVLLPSALAALGHGPDAEERPEALRGEGLRPIASAAVEAVRTPGTELDGVEVAGARRGVRGLWVELRHRRRHRETDDRGAQDSRTEQQTDRQTDGQTTDPRRAQDVRQRPARSPGRAARVAGCWRQSWLKIARMRSRLV